MRSLSIDVSSTEGTASFVLLAGLQLLVTRLSTTSRAFRRALTSRRALLGNGSALPKDTDDA
ncbi:hypothetical protein [Microbacterium cremeum]|uniref:hypothetical protein n=1 Tax=Microbacterium cremeum TaxID=2782169 RepID=UPI0018887CA1|nr:hypothetical protein [Microbacterium cremeum]